MKDGKGYRALRQGRIKILVIMAGVLLAVPVSASAMLMNFDTTGERAERIDTAGYLPSQGFGPVGGPAANNSLGYAMQFRIAEQTRLKNLQADILVHDYNLGADYVEFDFKIYSGTTVNPRMSTGYIPDIGTLVAQQRVYLTNDEFVSLVYDDYQTRDLNLDLDPGTYWIAYEREYGQGMSPGLISDLKYEGNVVVNPEPSTLGLMAVGLLGAGGLMRRRR